MEQDGQHQRESMAGSPRPPSSAPTSLPAFQPIPAAVSTSNIPIKFFHWNSSHFWKSSRGNQHSILTSPYFFLRSVHLRDFPCFGLKWTFFSNGFIYGAAGSRVLVWFLEGSRQILKCVSYRLLDAGNISASVATCNRYWDTVEGYHPCLYCGEKEVIKLHYIVTSDHFWFLALIQLNYLHYFVISAL